jgi:ribose 1,5-bisphosphokinase
MNERQQGTMIAVVGPSGAGKDSLIDFARRKLANDTQIGFVRRFITRKADVGSEDHHAVTLAQFEAMRDAGGFAVHWGAHDLHYGIPADTRDQLADGRTLIANGSRAALPEFRNAYPNLLVVTVTADAEIIAQRLRSRGREDDAAISKRLARSKEKSWLIDCRHVEIDNSGMLEIAGSELVTLILRTANSGNIVENA